MHHLNTLILKDGNNRIMRLKYLLIFFLAILIGSSLDAQPIPCEEPAEMTSFCADACIICDIDGFTGRHESTIVGEAPPGFAGECTFVAHNMQWIAFIAGSTDLSVQMQVSNCEQGFGLEFGLYKGINCNNFVRISNCFGGNSSIGENQSGTITNTEPLVIGQYYFIVMDGGLGDNCDWTFNVLTGSTSVDPLTTSGQIQGDNSVCPNLLQQYFVDPPAGATEFEWTINNAVQDVTAPNLDYTFTTEGIFNICVTAKNACDEAPPSCYQVIVENIPVTEIEAVFCEGENYEIAGEVLTEGGSYQFDFLNEEGCDSIVQLELTELTTPLLDLSIQICEGDTIFIGDTPYTETGLFQENLLTTQNCDSIVMLDLFTIVCNITSSDNPIPVVCNGEASGMIEFSVANGTAPFTYTWEELNGLYSGAGNISALGEVILIEDIPAGTYLITIDDGFGNFDVIISEVNEPSVLELDFVASDYNGNNVSCEDSADGILTAEPVGGVSPYFYSWDTGSSLNTIDDLNPGMYMLTVTDNGGCTVSGTTELTAPDPVILIAEFQDPECAGPFTGNITAVQTIGGTGAYTYSLNNSAFSDDPVFDGLGEGIYTLEVMDENGCIDGVVDTLFVPQIPNIDLGDNLEISLGTTINLAPSINMIDILSLNWTSSELIECPECLEQNIVPFNSANYVLSVTSVDNCTDVDSIYIDVNKFRKIYVPNVFSPDFNGTNDFFTIFGGPEVARIKNLKIFNRWGALMFEASNIESGIESLGWNGTYKNKEMDEGIYAWMAEVEFIDGVVLMYSGDIAIVR